MEVDQKHVTVIRLHDAKGSDLTISREGGNYVLAMTAKNSVVNITLGAADVRKLCQQLVQLDIEENWKPAYVPAAMPETSKSFFEGAGPRLYHPAMTSWFAKMAG